MFELTESVALMSNLVVDRILATASTLPVATERWRAFLLRSAGDWACGRKDKKISVR